MNEKARNKDDPNVLDLSKWKHKLSLINCIGEKYISLNIGDQNFVYNCMWCEPIIQHSVGGDRRTKNSRLFLATCEVKGLSLLPKTFSQLKQKKRRK